MDRSSDCPSVRHKCSSTKAVAVALLKLLICMEISSQVSSSVDNTCVHVHLEGGSGVRLFLTFDKMQDSPSNSTLHNVLDNQSILYKCTT